ncbi:MAG: xylulokinase [Thermomicrobiales bacterium]
MNASSSNAGRADDGAAVIALDLGTSSLKALAVDDLGNILRQTRRSYPIHHPHPGWNEQDPGDWWRAARETIRELTASLPDLRVAAIGITGQMHGTVVLNAQGESLSPAVIWSDRRAVVERDAIANEIGRGLATIIGGPLGAGYQATTLRWFAAHRPNMVSPTATCFLPKDALGFHLTGVRATEPSDAVSTGLMDARTETWDPALLQAARINESQLPPIVPSGTIIGGLRADLAADIGLEAGTPVILAGGDAPCGAIGAGVTFTTQAMLMLSSGAQVILPSADDSPDPAGRWHTFPSAIGAIELGQSGCRRNRVGATSNAGIAFEWFSRITQTAVTDFLDLAGEVPAGSRGALFIPSLTGQRTPVLDSGARGTFFGLTDQHGIPELARALVEGVILACRHAFATMTTDRDLPTTLLLGGGPSQHPVVRQVVADVLGLPVQPLDSPDLSALGTARIAARALGWPEWTDAARSVEKIVPNAAHRAIYDRLYAIHIDAADASREISHRLNATQMDMAR